MILILTCIILLLLTYFKLMKPYSYWKDKNVPSVKNPWPVFGNICEIVLRTHSIIDGVEKFYQSGRGKRYIGAYTFFSPILIIRDVDLIKQMTVKDFDTFPDRKGISVSDDDKMAMKSIGFLKRSEGWQDMRSTLSPSFTSSKMKMIFKLMRKCSDQVVDHLMKERDFVKVDVKDLFSRSATDVIASTVFGIQLNSLNDTHHEFFLRAKAMTTITGMKSFILLISNTFIGRVKTLRRSVGAFADRRAVKPYTIEPKLPGEKPVHLPEGTIIWVPLHSIHYDPQYYKNPEKFDPERFNDENKHNIKPSAYLPFGTGPRSCIGSRFAILELKIFTFKLLQHFEIVPIEKTKIPYEYPKATINTLSSKDGMWLGFKKREG